MKELIAKKAIDLAVYFCVRFFVYLYKDRFKKIIMEYRKKELDRAIKESLKTRSTKDLSRKIGDYLG